MPQPYILKLYHNNKRVSRKTNSLSTLLSPYIPMPKCKGFTAFFGKFFKISKTKEKIQNAINLLRLQGSQ